MAAVEDADFMSFLASFGGDGGDELLASAGPEILAPLPYGAPLSALQMLHDPLLSAGGFLPPFGSVPAFAGMGNDADLPPGGRQQQQQQQQHQGGKKAGGKGLSQSALECNRRHRRKKKEEVGDRAPSGAPACAMPNRTASQHTAALPSPP